VGKEKKANGEKIKKEEKSRKKGKGFSGFRLSSKPRSATVVESYKYDSAIRRDELSACK